MQEKSALQIDGSPQYLGARLSAPTGDAVQDKLRAEALALLKRNGFQLDADSRVWRLLGKHAVLTFLATHGEKIGSRYNARYTEEFARRMENVTLARLDVRARLPKNTADDSFALTAQIKVGKNDTLPEKLLRDALLLGRSYIELPKGKIVLLPPDVVSNLTAVAAILDNTAGDGGAPPSVVTRNVSTAELASVESALADLGIPFEPPKQWSERSAALRSLNALKLAPTAPEFQARLRLYQQIGVAWLWHLHRHELGGILADEMGLGKTIEALAFMDAAAGAAAPPDAPNFLVVCPAALVENWCRETARFTKRLRVVRHHGADRADSLDEPVPVPAAPAVVSGQWPVVSGASPVGLRSREGETASSLTTDHRPLATGHRPVVSGASPVGLRSREGETASSLTTDHRPLATGHRPLTTAPTPPATLYITSYTTLARDLALFCGREWETIIADEGQNIKNPRSQNARSLRTLRARSRFILTGTPVENSLDDLRSLFGFLLPGYLPTLTAGAGRDRELRAWHDRRALEKAAPYILRRVKRSVAPELPEKIEQTLVCELEGAQAKLYAEWRDRARHEIFELEMAGAGDAKLRARAFVHLLRLRQICAEPRLLDPDLAAADSAKFRALREILDEAADGGHRVLVFSQFVEVLTRLRAELDALKIRTCYIDGATKDRQRECDRFNADEGILAFLISLKAGGTGLNLTGADTVVHYDPWWNPAVEAQATDRAHRIGQTRVVTSVKLVAAGTVEERVLDLQREKRALLEDLFAEADVAASRIGLAEIKALLE
ncbi:MAG: DEAD/DEAH box helicase [Puniceicoccales bacterium]|jgi:SNF2 family DNA or RNA helicase|nr:DEAD/DEAH box helicase [Puniceicoccales bacterium]